MTGLLTSIVSACAGWKSIYEDSSALSNGVTFVHLAGLLVGGGAAFAADRATWRLRRAEPGQRQQHLDTLHHTHPVVIWGLGASLVSGLLMIAADAERLLVSPLMWLKLGVVALLLANGGAMVAVERLMKLGRLKPERAWAAFLATALISGVLWLGATFVGVLLLGA